mmetsp:Transcript_15600/g.33799  ORF Transcript_15600/g.33799 Transcript_15600/m.33799 type:complete len:356 (-) Transcript_15600:136-1203(-)|eukprot:CAMPEP_0172312608 /NCGR_PEP_ID=MMETSP1058-20130122/18131_1 /TAXON_ID=83371 /ORGANISM="Detonula confervacea, Strain CCMP 353" /LENGTH=355 /DNA_ID=CAMNT_0013026125 /DNA_START=42 /DNA_END=1109 /DNA_ORIENTATION=-
MGYDSNIKSAQSERRQRLIIVVSLIALSTAFFLVVSLLSSPPPANTNGGITDDNSRLAAIKSMEASGSLRGENEVRKSAAGNNANKPVPPPPKNDFALSSASQKSEKEAATIRADLEAQVRSIKKTGVIMETDAKSLELTGKLQDATRELIALRYGDFGITDNKKFRVKFDLEFQSTIPDFEEKGKEGSLTIELAPISLIPCSVYNFLEIARTWKKGAFHRNAGHVLQAMSRSAITESMPFQEYSKEYPHKKGTLGYAGRPSGPEFYVSIQDNTRAHGPGSQQQHNPHEADCIIGTVIQGMEDGTVDRIHTMPGKEFMGDKKKWVWIRRMHILIPGDGPDEYVEFSNSPLVIPAD